MTSHVFYGLAFLVMLGLTYSYGFAFCLTKKNHILALFMFMLATTLQTFSAVWQLYSQIFTGGVGLVLPFRTLRGMLLAITAMFLLYTTWRKNGIK